MRFGTDGIRGVANVDITPEVALAVGRAAAVVLERAVVVGRDPRQSGAMLEAAFVAGVMSAGVDVIRVGIAPTPAIAWAAADLDIAGAVISASHNPWTDNGIKLFAAGGRKLDGPTQGAVEAALDTSPPTGPVGSITLEPQLVHRWTGAVQASLAGRQLAGLSVVIDCANGAGAWIAADAVGALGALVHVINAEPDGRNINVDCGAADPAALQAAVLERGADLGIALDGDADRCIAVDGDGAVVDGDHILAVLALDRRDRGALPHDTVVVTVMSNLGFHLAMAENGIAVVETPVGDRHVLEALEQGGFGLGGEQSGHVIQRDLATTGDGLLTGIHLADVMVRTRRPLADLAAVMSKLPQVLRNVALRARGVDVAAAVAGEVAAAERELGDRGRVLLRASGTEPVVRVMVEAPTRDVAAAVADRLVAAIESAVGGG